MMLISLLSLAGRARSRNDSGGKDLKVGITPGLLPESGIKGKHVSLLVDLLDLVATWNRSVCLGWL